MIIGFIICSIVAVIFAGIGISCRKSKEAVGFFTFIKPPAVAAENIKKYNHDVSVLWMIAAILLEIISTLFLYAKQNSPMVVFMIPAVFLLVIAMMYAFIRIESKYKA